MLPEEVVLIIVLLLQSRLIPTLLPYLQYNHSHDTASIFTHICLHHELYMLLYQKLVFSCLFHVH